MDARLRAVPPHIVDLHAQLEPFIAHRCPVVDLHFSDSRLTTYMVIPTVHINRRLRAFPLVLASGTDDELDVILCNETGLRAIEPVPQEHVARTVGLKAPILGEQTHKSGRQDGRRSVQPFVELVEARIPGWQPMGWQPAFVLLGERQARRRWHPFR